ncbi:hypothetical protein N7539_000109 [Penicillium diatomitis]|uniref:Uncharacterized protein n=1 Tax=Penicillium diatomitis TaxID=2819901 RepID=A0A9X0C1V7_9EURO|nr:uncharacterized protein N7539_000109 [Penicillium diatomitis]KAJ5494993.1 hypothetical protein N7539_000109 [Penicillium diatomitis]
MHATLAVVLAYDRYSNSSSESRRTLRSKTLFNMQLSRRTIRAHRKDTIWGTAAAPVVLTIATPEARAPAKTWPLSP